MLKTLYRKIDSDFTGVIGFAELREWMTGKMRRINKAREVQMGVENLIV